MRKNGTLEIIETSFAELWDSVNSDDRIPKSGPIFKDMKKFESITEENNSESHKTWCVVCGKYICAVCDCGYMPCLGHFPVGVRGVQPMYGNLGARIAAIDEKIAPLIIAMNNKKIFTISSCQHDYVMYEPNDIMDNAFIDAGIRVHRRLGNSVARWCGTIPGVKVKKIIDSINLNF